MTADHDFERRIADHYLAEAPARAPGWVLERALASVAVTPQRRTVFGRPPRLSVRPWTVARLGVAAVAIAAVGLVGLTLMRQPAVGPVPSGSGSPSASPRPSPSPGWSRFDSTFNGMSIDYPSGWTARAATVPWGGTIAFDAPDVDVLFDPTFRGDLYLAVVSEPLGSKSPREWVRDHTGSPSLGICYSGGSGGIGDGFQGNPAWFQECHEPTGGSGHIVIFATPTRGYVIYNHVADEPNLQATYGERWFSGEGGVLDTVELRPEEALDGVPPSASPPTSPASSTQPSPSAGTARFDSTITGMSIDYPSGWQTKPATESWTGGPLSFDSPAADVIFDPATRDRAYLVIASKPLDSLSGNWQHEVIAWLCNGSGGEMWGIPGGIDSVRAEAHRCGHDDTGIFIETKTRGYFVRPVVSSDDPVLAARYDWAWVESLLRTLDLRPGDAVTPSASPERTAPASRGVTRLDGEVLRFTGDHSPWVGDLVAVHPETGATRVLIKDLKALDTASWSADGRWIAYDDGALWVVGSDNRPRQLAVGATGWTWSGDGARLAIVLDRDVSIYDAPTGQTVDLGEVEGTPTWSPDGTRIVFGEQGGSIYSVDVRTGERRLLVRLPGDHLDSVDRIEWSPDGSRLAIVNDLEPGLFRLFMLNADGSDVRVVAEDVNVSGLGWSPDGTRIAFAESSDPELRIWVAPADGSAPSLIGVQPNQDDGGDPVWSPDASQVAFWTEPDTAFVTAADGSGGVTALPARTYEDWRGGWYACGWCATFGFQAF